MNSNRLLEELRNLEVELHRPDVRSNVERLDTLLHESLVEFGGSGRSYNKADIIEQLPEEKSKGSIWSQDYSLEEIADGVALLMYRSAHLHENGELTRHTNRSSLWQRTAFGWQMRFHQGTPIEEFLINATIQGAAVGQNARYARTLPLMRGVSHYSDSLEL